MEELIYSTDKSMVQVTQNKSSSYTALKQKPQEKVVDIMDVSNPMILRQKENYTLGSTIYIQQQEDDDKKPQIPAARK